MTYKSIIRFSRKYYSKGEGREIVYVYWKIFVWDKNNKKRYAGIARTLKDAVQKKREILADDLSLRSKPTRGY
jgi:hypothetical protein